MAPRKSTSSGTTAKASKSTKPSGASTQAAADRQPVSSNRRASFTAPGLDREVGEKVADELQSRLVSLIDLSLTLKHIHWNVVGPSFIGVHMMLDPQYEGVSLMIDAVAERVATLGGVPSGLPGKLVETRTWDDYDLGRAETQAHLAALDLVYRAVISDHRASIDAVDDIDPVSGDLLIGQTGILEEYHWFVRSHLSDYAGGLSNAGEDTELGAAASAIRRQSSRSSAAGGKSTR